MLFAVFIVRSQFLLQGIFNQFVVNFEHSLVGVGQQHFK